MTYENFYDIADYLNEQTCYSFNNREVACFAYDYLMEYESSVFTPTDTMVELCKNLVLAIDVYDYDDIIDSDWDELTRKQMDDILKTALGEI